MDILLHYYTMVHGASRGPWYSQITGQLTVFTFTNLVGSNNNIPETSTKQSAPSTWLLSHHSLSYVTPECRHVTQCYCSRSQVKAATENLRQCCPPSPSYVSFPRPGLIVILGPHLTLPEHLSYFRPYHMNACLKSTVVS